MSATRRGALAAIAALAAGGASATGASPHLDAELFRLCAELHRCDEAVTALDATESDDPARTEEAFSAADDALAEATKATLEAEPRTIAGLAAKARACRAVLCRYVDEFNGGEEGMAELHEWFALTLAEDVMQIGALAIPNLPPKRVYEPLPPSEPTELQLKMRADGEALAAVGLHRQGGLTVGDVQIIAWLLRRIAAEMGDGVAERVRELSTVPADRFGPGYAHPVDNFA